MDTTATPTIDQQQAQRTELVTRPEDEPTAAERQELIAQELREAILRKVGPRPGRYAASS